jgi:hypothetical protein
LDAIPWPGGDWQATARLAATLVIGYLALMWLASINWTYRDNSSRTRDPISQAVCLAIVVVLPILGLPIYMALRPPETLQQSYDREVEQEAILADIQTVASCPACRRPAEAEFRVCAYCGTSLKEPCSRCNTLMLHAWRYCPQCATPRAASAPMAAPVAMAPPSRLDFSAGDEAYDDLEEPVRTAAPMANGTSTSATPAPRTAPPARTRRPVSRIGGSADNEAPPQREPRSAPAPTRRTAANEE